MLQDGIVSRSSSWIRTDAKRKRAKNRSIRMKTKRKKSDKEFQEGSYQTCKMEGNLTKGLDAYIRIGYSIS
jgi:hypothetical protein